MPSVEDEHISLVDADFIDSSSGGEASEQRDQHGAEINGAHAERGTVESDVKYSAQFLVAILKPVQKCLISFIIMSCIMLPLGVFDYASCRYDHSHLRRLR